MEPSLRAHPCIEHAVASDALTDADVTAAFAKVRPLALQSLDAASQLLGLTDPFEAEAQGAVAVSALLRETGGKDAIGFAMFAALLGLRNDAAASAIRHAVDVIAPGPAGHCAAAEMRRLEKAGIPRPPWEPLLAAPVRPVTAWLCSPVLESGGAPHSVMVFEFERAGATHGFIVHRDFRGDGSIGKISAVPNIGWSSFRKFLLAGEAFEAPYAIEELDFGEAADRFDAPRSAMWSRLREDPARFAGDRDLGGVPGLALLLERHMTAAA